MMKRRTDFLAVIVVLLLSAVCASAQGDKVEWSAKVPGKVLNPSEKVFLALTAKISEGWHIYSFTQPPGGPSTSQVTLPTVQPFKTSGPIVAPPPHKVYDSNFEMETESYEGTVDFSLPIAVQSNAPSGKQNVAVDVRFQTCSETTCLPPKTVHLSAPVIVAIGATKVRLRVL
jgi:DsbC/DsbD-like thiol-disulfide interchange protein